MMNRYRRSQLGRPRSVVITIVFPIVALACIIIAIVLAWGT